MSYTIIVDEQERKRQFENRVNAVIRHCRIGKVTPKPPNHWRQKTRPTGWHPSVGAPSFAAGGFVHVTSSADVPLVPSHGVSM